MKDFEGEGDLNDMVILIKTDHWVRMRYHSNFRVPPQYLIMGKALAGNLCVLVWVPFEQAS